MGAVAEVVDFLQAVLRDVVENVDDFKRSDEETPMMFMGMPISQRQKNEGAFRKYRINVLVDNAAETGAPVITESNPVLQNLVGRIEHQAQFGALFTDFNMIKRGLAQGQRRLPRPRGSDVLFKPFPWEALNEH